MSNRGLTGHLDCLLQQISAHLQQLIIAIQPCASSGSHFVFKIQLNDKKWFLVKQLNASYWLGQRERKEIFFCEDTAHQVAQALKNTYGALKWPKTGYFVPGLDEWFIVIPFRKGQCFDNWSPVQAEALGKMLGELHQIGLSKKNAKLLPPVQLNHVEVPDWCCDLITTCNQYRSYELQHMVLSHRDLHHGNVIWQEPTKPYLIDWESAGLIHPFVELIGLAVNASGMVHGRFNRRLFSSVLQGYQTQVGQLPLYNEVLWLLCFHSWLLWYEYCLKSSLNSEAKKTLHTIKQLASTMDIIKDIYQVIVNRL